MMLDFDNIKEWGPNLASVLRQHLPDSVEQKLLKAAPKYVEDARDLLFELTDRDAVIDKTLVWLSSQKIMGYHGSRLTNAEMMSVQAVGLMPLEACNRRDRLVRALSPHPRWSKVVAQLDAVIQAYGQYGRAGRREGQVHLTLSRAGLVDGFDHYLTYGAEFDQHVAYELLGDEGKELLARDGKARVIKIAIPGASALEAAHPIFGIDDLRAKGDVPNLVDEFLKSWSYQLAYPNFQSYTLEVDCGMMFRQSVPATWIVSIETL